MIRAALHSVLMAVFAVTIVSLSQAGTFRRGVHYDTSETSIRGGGPITGDLELDDDVCIVFGDDSDAQWCWDNTLAVFVGSSVTSDIDITPGSGNVSVTGNIVADGDLKIGINDRICLDYPGCDDGLTGLTAVSIDAISSAPYDFSDVAYVATRLTVSTDSTVDPNGTSTADTLAEDGTAANNHFIYQSVSHTNGQPYVMSMWVKPANRDWVALYFGSGAFGGEIAYFNVTTGSVGTYTTEDAGMIQYKNGWYRVWAQETAVASSSSNLIIFIAEADNDFTFNGLSQDSLYAWGFSMEAASGGPTASLEADFAGALDVSDSISVDGTAVILPTGSPADNQVCVFKTGSTIEGDSAFTWDGSSLQTVANDSYLNLTGQSTLDTGMSGIYDRSQTVNACLVGTCTVTITGAGTYTDTPENKNLMFNSLADFFQISGTDNTTTKIVVHIDMGYTLGVYADGNKFPFVQYRLGTGQATYYDTITVEVSTDDVSWYKPGTGQWETTDYASDSQVSGYWFGGRANPGITAVRYVRWTLEERVEDAGYAFKDRVWISQLGLRHSAHEYAPQFLKQTGGDVYGDLAMKSGQLELDATIPICYDGSACTTYCSESSNDVYTCYAGGTKLYDGTTSLVTFNVPIQVPTYTREFDRAFNSATVGATAPSSATIGNSRCLQFNQSQTGETAHTSFEVQDDWIGTTDYSVELYVFPVSGDAPQNGEVIEFDLSYNIMGDGDPYDGTSTTIPVSYTEAGSPGEDKGRIKLEGTMDYDDATNTLVAGETVSITVDLDETATTYSGNPYLCWFHGEYDSNELPTHD